MGNSFDTTASAAPDSDLYVSAAELRAYKYNGRTVDLTAYTDAELEAELTTVQEMLDYLLGDWFNERTVTELFDGLGHYELFFTTKIPAPCISITSVKELQVDGTVRTTYTAEEDFKVYPHYLRVPRESRGFSARENSFGGGRWPLGEQNIQVIGVFGRSTTPTPIKRAMMIMALESLKPGSSGVAPRDVIQAVWNDFTVTFRSNETREGDSTGIAEVDRLIQPYVNYTGLFQVLVPERTLHDRD